MKKVRVVFHKGKDSLIGRLIIGWTWVLAALPLQWDRLKYNYSHVEVWFPDERGRFEDNSGHPVGRWFSSTTRGGSKGVRMADADEVLKHPERWDYIEIDIKQADYDTMITWSEVLAGEAARYDYRGIFGFILPFNVQDRERWYCSEICAFLLWNVGVLKLLHTRISPRRLAMVLVSKVLCGKIFSLTNSE